MNLPPRYKPLGGSFAGGGMSTAIMCMDQHLERTVLVKALQSGVDQRRIQDEVAALSAIRSKHVVQIYDVIKDTQGNVNAIVEEYLPGPELGDSLPVDSGHDLLMYAYAIACGLSDVHAVKIVHRDIKPNNMKFDAEDCLKIFDFGLSRAEAVDASTVGTVGTPGYLAPELCVPSYQTVKFTPAVDVYAFGATILKLMHGKVPGDLRKIPPKLPCSDAAFDSQTIELPVRIVELFRRCLSERPEDRPTMSDVRDALAKHLLDGKHKATLIVEGQLHFLDRKGQRVKLSAGNLGSLSVSYDGQDFVVSDVDGNVYVNNIEIHPPFRFPGACVITLGAPVHGSERRFITFDIAHPEVIL